jgi:hypothetical protein
MILALVALEKATRSLAEEKTTRQTAKQYLRSSDEARTGLAWDIESA